MGPMKAAGKGKKKGGNKGVGIDFKKVKHKVGKKLAKAQNETDVDFRSKSINMPSQAVQEDKDGLNVNFHNLTLQELLAQTGHYSEKARKNAFLGMADLFNRHPEEIRQHAHQFFPKIAERVGDPDQGVRVAMRALLREQVMPAIHAGALRPFMPVIMAHVSGAMTNLNISVRLDALNFLDVLMDFAPELVTVAFLSPCLHHFCDLLSSAHRGRNIKAQSLSSLVKVLNALNSFLSRAFRTQTTSSATNSAPPSSKTKTTQPTQARISGPVLCERSDWAPRDKVSLLEEKLFLRGEDGAWLAHDPSRTKPKQAASKDISRQPLYKQLQQQQNQQKDKQSRAGATPTEGEPGEGAEKEVLGWRLVELLFGVWAECAPGQISTKPELESVKALSLILSAVSMLITKVLLDKKPTHGSGSFVSTRSSSSSRDLASLTRLSGMVIKHVAPNFPATAPAVKPAADLVDAMVKYNLMGAQLLVELLPAASAGAAAADRQTSPETEAPWVDVLVGYLCGVLDKGALLPTKGILSEAQTSEAQLASASYDTLLQYVCSAVPIVSKPHATSLVVAVSGLGSRLPAKSSVRGACVQIQQSLVVAYQRGDLLLDEELVISWLAQLPKLLWELGSSNPELTSIALSMLHGASCCSIPGTPLATSLTSLQQQLTPLFCASVPQSAKKKQKIDPEVAAGGGDDGMVPVGAGAKGVECAVCSAAEARLAAAGEEGATLLIAGPLSKAELRVQNLAIDVLYHLGPLDRALLRALLPALHTNVLPDVAALRLCEVIAARLPDTDPACVMGWLLTILFSKSQPGTTNAPTAPCSWARRRSLADVVCRAIPTWAPASVVLQLLGVQLSNLVKEQGGPEGLTELQSYSLLKLHMVAAQEVHQKGAADEAPGGKEIPEEVSAAVPWSLVNLYHKHLARLVILHKPPSSGSPEAAVCLDLLKADPALVVPVIETACAKALAASSKSGEEQQQHSASCARTTFMYTAALLQEVLKTQQLQKALLAGKQKVEAAVGSLTTHAAQAGQLSGDETCQAEGRRLKQAVKHIFAS